MISRNPSGYCLRTAFRLALVTLGYALILACHLSARFRDQLAHGRTVQIGSADGVWYHFRFTPRAVALRAGRIAAPDVGLCFDNAGLGLVTLLSPRAVGRIVRALLARQAEYEGNAVLVLWFFALTRFVLPIGRTARLSAPLPDAYTAYSPTSRVASRITREAPATALDPQWAAAHQRHARMVMPRGCAGDPSARLW